MTVQDTLQAVRAHEDEFIALRRDIHQHPELPFEELRTSDLVAARLRDWGYHVERGLGGTGVVGQLKRGDGKRTLGLRADMDALPVSYTHLDVYKRQFLFGASITREVQRGVVKMAARA